MRYTGALDGGIDVHPDSTFLVSGQHRLMFDRVRYTVRRSLTIQYVDGYLLPWRVVVGLGIADKSLFLSARFGRDLNIEGDMAFTLTLVSQHNHEATSRMYHSSYAQRVQGRWGWYRSSMVNLRNAS